jgi:hypothetical protein
MQILCGRRLEKGNQAHGPGVKTHTALTLQCFRSPPAVDQRNDVDAPARRGRNSSHPRRGRWQHRRGPAGQRRWRILTTRRRRSRHQLSSQPLQGPGDRDSPYRDEVAVSGGQLRHRGCSSEAARQHGEVVRRLLRAVEAVHELEMRMRRRDRT